MRTGYAENQSAEATSAGLTRAEVKMSFTLDGGNESRSLNPIRQGHLQTHLAVPPLSTGLKFIGPLLFHELTSRRQATFSKNELNTCYSRVALANTAFNLILYFLKLKLCFAGRSHNLRVEI